MPLLPHSQGPFEEELVEGDDGPSAVGVTQLLQLPPADVWGNAGVLSHRARALASSGNAREVLLLLQQHATVANPSAERVAVLAEAMWAALIEARGARGAPLKLALVASACGALHTALTSAADDAAPLAPSNGEGGARWAAAISGVCAVAARCCDALRRSGVASGDAGGDAVRVAAVRIGAAAARLALTLLPWGSDDDAGCRTHGDAAVSVSSHQWQYVLRTFEASVGGTLSAAAFDMPLFLRAAVSGGIATVQGRTPACPPWQPPSPLVPLLPATSTPVRHDEWHLEDALASSMYPPYHIVSTDATGGGGRAMEEEDDAEEAEERAADAARLGEALKSEVAALLAFALLASGAINTRDLSMATMSTVRAPPPAVGASLFSDVATSVVVPPPLDVMVTVTPPSSTTPPLVPTIISPATLLSWVVHLVQPLASECAAGAVSTAREGGVGTSHPSSSAAGGGGGGGDDEVMMGERVLRSSLRARATHLGCLCVNLLTRVLHAAPPLPCLTLAMAPHAPSPTLLTTHDPSSTGATTAASAPLPIELLLQALVALSMHAHTEGASTDARLALTSLLHAHTPRSRAALLGPLLSACPYPQMVAHLIDTHLRPIPTRHHSPQSGGGGGSGGVPLSPTEALGCLLAVVHSRIEQGVCAPSMGGSRKSGSGAATAAAAATTLLLQSDSTSSSGATPQQAAERVRMGEYLSRNGDVDCSILSALRLLLLQEKRSRGGQGPLTSMPLLLPPAHASLLRDAYVQPLHRGVALAHEAHRDALGMLPVLHAHPSPFEGRGGGVATSVPRPLAPSERTLSKLFLLESALVPVRELL